MLSDILLDIANEEGTRVAVGEVDRDITVFYINKAAREIWQKNDFEEWTDEVVLDVDVDSQTVAFPYEIGLPRGMRYVSTETPIELHAKRNRYHRALGSENEVWSLRWRDRGLSALYRNIENESRLVFSIPSASAEPFSLTVTGSNPNKSKILEIIDFSLGDLEVQSIENYSAISSIVKNDSVEWDITIADVETNVLAVLPNHANKTSYRILQILDTEDSTAAQTDGVEVLFKRSYQPLSVDTDSFFNTDEYDAAIIAKYFESRKKDPKEKSYYRALSQELINAIQADRKIGQKEKVDFRVSPWFNLPYNNLVRVRR